MDCIVKLKYTIDALFGNNVSKYLPKNITFSFSTRTGRIKSVYYDGKLLCTLRIDGGLAITILLAKILLKSKKFKENCLEVDKISKPFIENGRSVFCNHIIWCGKNILIKADVPILYKNNVIAIGKSILTSQMIKTQKKGMAIKIRNSLKSSY